MLYSNLRALASQCDLILGSRSPRRVELLRETGVSFAQQIPEIDETMEPGETPFPYAQRLACEKAISLSNDANSRALILGCDTVVVLDDVVLGKPTDKNDAFRILSLLSGKPHVVCTALALVDSYKRQVSAFSLTTVYFNSVSARQISTYIESGEPMDKAGAYGIQGMGAFLVDRIEGELDTVIGLPRNLLDNLAAKILLKEWGN